MSAEVAYGGTDAQSGEQKLVELRIELDQIDEVLKAAIRDRIGVCVRVAHVKRDHAIPMMQPGRVGVVIERARSFASANGLSPDFLEQLYRSMIAEACRVEDEIIDGSAATRDVAHE